MNIKELRKEKGLTQQQLAEMCGLNNNTLSRLEQGRYKPSFNTLQKLSEALGITINELVGFNKEVK